MKTRNLELPEGNKDHAKPIEKIIYKQKAKRNEAATTLNIRRDWTIIERRGVGATVSETKRPTETVASGLVDTVHRRLVVLVDAHVLPEIVVSTEVLAAPRVWALVRCSRRRSSAKV